MLKPIAWDKPFYHVEGTSFTPFIWEGKVENIPEEFNAVCIRLNGKMQADLNWKKEQEEAKKAIELNKYILWEIDLGLFSELTFPLTYNPQYLSLKLSLEHFRDSLWKEFGSHSLGLILYKGDADFSKNFAWDEKQNENLKSWLQDLKKGSQFTQEDELKISGRLSNHYSQLFCRDVAIEYITLLSSCLPDEVARYILLENTVNDSPLSFQIQQLHPDRYDQFNLALNDFSAPLQALGWKEKPTSFGFIGNKIVSPIEKDSPSIGVCIPPMEMGLPSHYKGLEEALQRLYSIQQPFKVISETYLITEWDGLDYLLYIPSGLSLQGKRKLQGFCAAGGTAVSLGEKIGLAQEITIEEFWNK